MNKSQIAKAMKPMGGIKCKTENEAKKLLSILRTLGWTWCSGRELGADTYWDSSYGGTYYIAYNSEDYENKGITRGNANFNDYSLMDFNLNTKENNMKDQNPLPRDVKQVFIREKDRAVTVELTNGTKGTSICSKYDTFDPYVGYTIAYDKAKNAGRYQLKKSLDSCVKSAAKKGYKVAIMQNRQ